MRSPMSRRGNCWDTAPTESLWGSLKRARILGQRFATRREAMDEVIDWLSFYNHSRLHSTLGYVSPMQFEQKGIRNSRATPVTMRRGNIMLEFLQRFSAAFRKHGVTAVRFQYRLKGPGCRVVVDHKYC
jgi:Integrase core domain